MYPAPPRLVAYKSPTRSSFLANNSIASSSYSTIAFLLVRSSTILLRSKRPINSPADLIGRSMSSSFSLLGTVRPAELQFRHGSTPCHGLTQLQPRRPRATTATVSCSAFRRDHYGGALVDEGMTVLRRRIREARMAETNYEAPPGWAAWEKRYYPAYVSDVSTLAGALQLMLMGTRPGVSVAVAALVLGGVPVSAAVALHLLGQAAGTLLHHVT
uniref:Uncharacterized protein n=1 Tax=Avena sativa TaxID=4498 RepID=A0ACD5TSI3_AVESA